MRKVEIKPGTHLRMKLDSTLEVQPNFELSSTFEVADGDLEFSIGAPMHRGAYYPINVGELVYFSYYDDLARYDFQGVILERYRDGELAFLRARQTTEIIRTQRREDYRLDVSFRGTLEYEEFNGVEYETKKIAYMTLDLSGGGAAVFLNTYFGLGKKVFLTLPIGELGGPLRLECEVRWMRQNVKGAIYKYIVGLKFLFKFARDKQSIIRYIFREQQKRLKKDVAKPLPLRDELD
ncbi:flagellar brake protein [Oscillospiraceae bacterium OttesenSCG-928-G22]|nr:flagellar brake protein [Oscillospiraceae bacterium OttesenSCG-928-G22]